MCIRDRAESAAQAAWTRVFDVNAAYLAALDAGETEQAEKLLAESRALNDAVLKAFRFAEDSFVRLTWEDVSIFPHENGQNNIDVYKRQGNIYMVTYERIFVKCNR